MTGKSILGAILDRRFDQLKRHLRDSDVSIEKLITACGFKTISNAKNLDRSLVQANEGLLALCRSEEVTLIVIHLELG